MQALKIQVKATLAKTIITLTAIFLSMFDSPRLAKAENRDIADNVALRVPLKRVCFTAGSKREAL